MTDKLIDENRQIERYGRTLKELEAEYGSMTPDELLFQAWAWAEGAKYSAKLDDKADTLVAIHITQWLIATTRKFQREGK